MSSMHRTQIYIPRDQLAILRHEADRRGESISAVIREAVRVYFDRRRSGPDAADPISRLVGFIDDGGPTDLAARHDDYLYGVGTLARGGRPRRR